MPAAQLKGMTLPPRQSESVEGGLLTNPLLQPCHRRDSAIAGELARDLGGGLSRAATSVRSLFAVWQHRRNATSGPIIGRFTSADARIKLKRLYPSIDE